MTRLLSTMFSIFLVFSVFGLAYAEQCSQAGNTVRCFSDDGSNRTCFKVGRQIICSED